MLIHSTAMGDQNRRLTEMSAVVTVVILLGSKRSGTSGIGADVRFIRRVHATNVLRDALRVFEHDSTSIHRARDRFRRIVDSLLVPLQHLLRGKRNGAHATLVFLIVHQGDVALHRFDVRKRLSTSRKTTLDGLHARVRLGDVSGQVLLRKRLPAERTLRPSGSRSRWRVRRVSDGLEHGRIISHDGSVHRNVFFLFNARQHSAHLPQRLLSVPRRHLLEPSPPIALPHPRAPPAVVFSAPRPAPTRERLTHPLDAVRQRARVRERQLLRASSLF